jgi:hypothetical protein
MPGSTLNLSVYDGTRNSLPTNSDLLITITDGNGRQVIRETFDVSNIEFKDLPFYDNFGDNYTALAFASGWKQEGYAPLKLSPTTPTQLDLMLIPDSPEWNFADLTWDKAKLFMPFLAPQPTEDD